MTETSATAHIRQKHAPVVVFLVLVHSFYVELLKNFREAWQCIRHANTWASADTPAAPTTTPNHMYQVTKKHMEPTNYCR